MSSTARLQHGWVAIDRQVWEHPAFADEAFSEREAWFWLISHAEYRTDAKVPRGCLVTSYQQLADAWHWSSRGKARHYMERLERDGMVVLMRSCIRISNYDDYQSNAPVNQAGSHNVRTNRAQQNETKSEACEAVAHNVRTNSAQNGFPPPVPPSYKETNNKSNPPPTPKGDAAEEEGASNIIPAPLLARPVVWQAGVLAVQFRVAPGDDQRRELRACGLQYSQAERCWLGPATRLDLSRLARLLPGVDLSQHEPVHRPPSSVHGAQPRRPSIPGPDCWMRTRRQMQEVMGDHMPAWAGCMAAVDTGHAIELVTDDEVYALLWLKNYQPMAEQIAGCTVRAVYDPARHADLVRQRTGGEP